MSNDEAQIPPGKIDLRAMQPFLEELVLRAGGVRPAARLVGVSHQSLMRWMGTSNWHNENMNNLSMTKNSAALVITTIMSLRKQDRRNGSQPRQVRDAIRKQAEREERLFRQYEEGCG